MKKLSILSIACVLYLICLQGQAQSLRLGIKGGLNLANQQIENEFFDFINSDFDTEFRPTFHGGLVLDIGFTDMFSVQPGLLLSSKGYRFEDGDLTLESKPLYLDIPVLFTARFGDGEVRPFLAAGPYLGFGLGGEIEGEIEGLGDGDNDIDFGDDNNDDLKPIDFGLSFGGGVELGQFQIGAAYNLGLANIQPNGDDDNYIRNRVISISVAYFFDLD